MPTRIRRDSETSTDSWSLVDDEDEQISVSSTDDDDLSSFEEEKEEEEEEEKEELDENQTSPIIEEPLTDLEEDTTQFEASDDESDIENDEISMIAEDVTNNSEIVLFQKSDQEFEKLSPIRIITVCLLLLTTTFTALSHPDLMRSVLNHLRKNRPDFHLSQQCWEPVAAKLRKQDEQFLRFPFSNSYFDDETNEMFENINFLGETSDYSIADVKQMVFDNETSPINWNQIVTEPSPPLNICYSRRKENKKAEKQKAEMMKNYNSSQKSFLSIFNFNLVQVSKPSKKSKDRAVQLFYNPTSKRRFARKFHPRFFPCLQNKTVGKSASSKNLPSLIKQTPSGYTKWYKSVNEKKLKMLKSRKASESMRRSKTKSLMSDDQNQCDRRLSLKYRSQRRPSIGYKSSASTPCLPPPSRPTTNKQFDWFTRRGHHRAILRDL